MAKNGLLAKPTHDDIIRLAPALTVNEQQVNIQHMHYFVHTLRPKSTVHT
jgi:acetylornithine/succinyldiaminopimelate/putrescine aminotransferase